MPNCKNCGSRISKFDKDICPVCGFVHPLNNVKSETVEITSEISISSDALKYKSKSKLTTFILFFLVGFLGVGYFYLSYKKRGLIWLIINVLFILGLSILLAYPLNFGLIYGILIPFIISYLVNTGIGIYYLAKNDVKDGRGDFLR
jgi:RNA polymerase subunit RPABC4/transcription elongation factor Spt4